VPVKMLGRTAFPPSASWPYLLTNVGPTAFYWFRADDRRRSPRRGTSKSCRSTERPGAGGCFETAGPACFRRERVVSVAHRYCRKKDPPAIRDGYDARATIETQAAGNAAKRRRRSKRARFGDLLCCGRRARLSWLVTPARPSRRAGEHARLLIHAARALGHGRERDEGAGGAICPPRRVGEDSARAGRMSGVNGRRLRGRNCSAARSWRRWAGGGKEGRRHVPRGKLAIRKTSAFGKTGRKGFQHAPRWRRPRGSSSKYTVVIIGERLILKGLSPGCRSARLRIRNSRWAA